MQDLYILATKLKFLPKNLSIGWKGDPYLWMHELQRWLREVHKIHINIQMLYQCNIEPAEFEGWIIYIAGESFETNYEINKDLISKVFKSYEEALEYGLFEMLKLIK